MTPNQTASRGRTAGTLRCSSARGRRAGFTIIELLVTILVIAILIGVLIVAISAALRQSRRAGEQQTVSGIQVGIGVFQSTFDNRLPPLVYDGEPIALVSHASTPRIPGGPTSGPVERQGASDPVVATYERIYQDGGTAVLTGRVPPGGGGPGTPLFNALRDPRYSKFALPIFLTGALGEDVDGRSGSGLRLTYTNRAGWQIGGRSEVREPFYRPSNESAIVSSYVSVDEYQEHGQAGSGVLPAGAADPSPDRTAYVNGAGVAVRYYRWEPSDPADLPAQSPTLAYLNIPQILIDPRTWTAPSESVPIELRSARYAVVSAGPNGLFGTEPIEMLRQRLGVGPGVAEDQVRYLAWEDNVVRVGVGR